MVEPKNVDLRLATTYIPVCIVFVQLFIINMFVFFSSMHPLHSWAVVSIVLWCLRRGGKEKIFKYNCLLQVVSLSSMMTHYRCELAQENTMHMRGVNGLLWSVWFASFNFYLSIKSQNMERNTAGKPSLWVVFCLMVLCSFFSKMKDNFYDFDNLKGFLFIVVSVSWVYLHDSHRLSHKKALSSDECILRFTALLMTTVTVCLCLFFCFMLGVIYFNNFHTSLKTVTEKKNEDERNPDVEKAEDINEIFKAAMAEKKANRVPGLGLQSGFEQ